MPADAKQLKNRAQRMWADRATWEADWQLIGDYLVPRKSNITKVTAPGQKLTDNIFDSTGMIAPVLFAAAINGTMTSASQQWFGLTMRQEELNERKDVRDWLEQVAKRTYLALNQSNFTSEINEVYLDLATFATAAMLIEERSSDRLGQWGGFRFAALTIGEYAIDEGPDGRVDTLFRRFKLSAKVVLQKWPDLRERPEQEAQALVKRAEDRPESPVEILHAVYPRSERNPLKSTRQHKAFASCYLTWQPEVILDEGGFDSFPFVVPRWSKTSGEIYGRGPGYWALPDVRTLNRLKELELGAGALAVWPPVLQQDDGVLGSVSLEPASLITVTQKDALMPFASGADWRIADWLTQDLKHSINAIYMVDVLRLREKPNMTATEVLALQEEMLRLLGPTAGRLQSELLSPLIERAIQIQYRAGALPPAPPILLEHGDIDVEYEGPLARAQRSRDLTAIERVDLRRANVRTYYPGVDDLYDDDKIERHFGEVAGLPSDMLRDKQQVDTMRAARLKQQQAAQQMQMMERMARPLKDAAQAGKAIREAGVPAGTAA